jgi:heme-degrading monooxygenase HmoA
MYSRVIFSQYHLGKMGEGLRIYREAILPALRQQEGFRGVLVLLDYRTNRALSITLWETEENLRQGAISGHLQVQLMKVAPLFSAAPSIETAEVAIWEIRSNITPQCARVTTFRLQPGKTLAFVQVIREKVLSIAMQQKGAEGMVVAKDASRNHVMTISLWERQSDMDASEADGNVRQHLAQGAPFLATAPARELYEIGLLG